MSQPLEDDLFKDSTMSFGQHLAELRVHLFRAIFGLMIGVAAGLALGKPVVDFIQRPLTRALEKYYLNKAEVKIKDRYPGLSPELLEVVLRQQKIFEDVSIEPGALLESLRQAFPDRIPSVRVPEFYMAASDVTEPAELCEKLAASGTKNQPVDARRCWELLTTEQRETVQRIATAQEITAADKRTLTALLNNLIARADLYDAAAFKDTPLSDDQRKGLAECHDTDAAPRHNWLLLATVFPGDLTKPHPYLTTMRMWRDVKDVQWVHPQSLTPTEAFMFWMKASMITGLILSSPWVFYQLWMFVAAGLYPHERRYVHIYLPVSLGLFLLGAALTFALVFDPVLQFLFDFNDWLGIEPSPRISDWLSFVLFMPLAFGLSFQLPLVMLFLDRIGVVEAQTYIKSWRLAILSIFIVSAILSPSPDPYSLMLMATPLTGLYFGGYLLCRWSKPKATQWD